MTQLFLYPDGSDGKPLYGAGSKAGYAFVKAYFPEATHTIRIASGYFRIDGYNAARRFIEPNVQLQILVGATEGKRVQESVLAQALEGLGQCTTDLWDAVNELIKRIENGTFLIRDARAMQVPFHCKFYISDNVVMWDGSCNFTAKGFFHQMEQLGASRDPEKIQRFIKWFDETIKEARDLLAELLLELQKWLHLATPFDAYLKTLLLLHNLPIRPTRIGAHIPLFFQKGVIARAIRQAEDYGGALIAAATGLGKTVIGAEIVSRLYALGQVKRCIHIAPTGVRKSWKKQLDCRDIYPEYFTIDLLFRNSSQVDHHRVNDLDRVLEEADHHTLILIDEAHFYRNELHKEVETTQISKVYQRLLPAIKNGAKIFLLTATAYGTNLRNLNSLLYLLPHQPQDTSEEVIPWEVKNADEFAKLPVVIVLGLPHVLKMARDRGDVDENGRTFIQYPNERRYLPKFLKLHAVRYQLFLEMDLQAAFHDKCFSQAAKVPQSWFDDDTYSTKKGVTDTIFKNSVNSWLSSPTAMTLSVEMNIATQELISDEKSQSLRTDVQKSTPNRRPNSYTSQMHLEASQRKVILEPLLAKLKAFTFRQDNKFTQLTDIIEKHCIQHSSKVIIFVNRHSTALYLADSLQKRFGKELTIGCTVELGKTKAKLKSSGVRNQLFRDFSPKSHDYSAKKEYNLLICTDADGVGINLEDADTVINYDPPSGADTLFQRVGRVLRMTGDPERTVYVYTLLPSFVDEQNNTSTLWKNISDIFNRITKRHDKSKAILGSEVHTHQGEVEITLEGDFEVEQLVRDGHILESIGGLGANSIISHASILEQYRERAEQLSPYLISAKTYIGSQHLIFILVSHANKHHPVIYNLTKQVFEKCSEIEVLDLISCEENTKCDVLIKPAQIEHYANELVQKWCVSKNIPLEEALKICTIYLEPAKKKHTAEQFFRNDLLSSKA